MMVLDEGIQMTFKEKLTLWTLLSESLENMEILRSTLIRSHR
jgi:hypothetical protein